MKPYSWWLTRVLFAYCDVKYELGSLIKDHYQLIVQKLTLCGRFNIDFVWTTHTRAINLFHVWASRSPAFGAGS